MVLKWRPSFPIRRPDKIISSDRRLAGDVLGFAPSYESETQVNMYYILSNEYYRMWFMERKRYEKITYAQHQTLLEESKIKRRYVQKDLKHKVPTKPLPIIKLKRFQNISSKTDHKRPTKIERNEEDKEKI